MVWIGKTPDLTVMSFFKPWNKNSANADQVVLGSGSCSVKGANESTRGNRAVILQWISDGCSGFSSENVCLMQLKKTPREHWVNQNSIKLSQTDKKWAETFSLRTLRVTPFTVFTSSFVFIVFFPTLASAQCLTCFWLQLTVIIFVCEPTALFLCCSLCLNCLWWTWPTTKLRKWKEWLWLQAPVWTSVSAGKTAPPADTPLRITSTTTCQFQFDFLFRKRYSTLY